MQGNIIFVMIGDRIIEEVNTERSLSIIKAIAKLPKYRNLFKLHFDVRKMGLIDVEINKDEAVRKIEQLIGFG